MAQAASSSDVTTTKAQFPSNKFPKVQHVREQDKITASPHHVVTRLITLAESFLSLKHPDQLHDPTSWENDLCSATFWATYALCMDPASIRARRLLARCARLGGYNLVLPFSPSGSAASSLTTSTRISSTDPNNRAGAQAAIHILQRGPSSTFTDVGCVKEYRNACHTLARNTDALQVTDILAPHQSLGKRKSQADEQDKSHSAPTLCSAENRYESQLVTDLGFEAARVHRPEEAAKHFKDALARDCWNWRAWTGLCDLGSPQEAGTVFSSQDILDLYQGLLDAQTSLPSPVSEAPFSDSESTVASSAQLKSDDASNKKAKLSDDDYAPSRAGSTTTTSARKPRTGSATVPAGTEVRKPNGNNGDATARVKANRALSNARTNTNQNVVVTQAEKDEKSTIKGVTPARATRSAANTSFNRATGMQLRSTAGRTGAPAARSTAPSQAGSTTSTSSSSTSRSTVLATTRTGVEGRRAITLTGTGTASSANGRVLPPTNGRIAPSATSARAPIALGRTAISSRAPAPASSAALSVSRAPVSSLASKKAEEAAQREAVAKARAELIARQKAATMVTARELAKWQAADLAILSLIKQIGEAYRLVRVYDGERAVAALQLMGGKGTSNNDPMLSLARNTIVFQCLLARAYNETAQYAQAEVHFESVRKLNPFILAHMDIYSLVLFQLNREVALSGLAQELMLIDPTCASTQIVVGNAFALQRENQTALISFQRAASMAPDYAYAYTLAGHEAHDLGNHDEATSYFRSAIRCDRRHWNAWAGLGRVFLLMSGHELAASKSFQQAISINPHNHVLWDLVGWTFAQMGRKRHALEAYNKSIALAPKLAVLTYLRRSELLVSQDELSDAHHDLVSAYNLAPEEGTIHMLLAQSYMRLGGGSFCEIEEGNKASGQMRMPTQYQEEITYHLSVAVDLDPNMLKVIKAMGEGWRTSPATRMSMNPADLSSSSANWEYSNTTGEILEDDEDL